MLDGVNLLLDQQADVDGGEVDLNAIRESFKKILLHLDGSMVPHVQLHGDLFFQNVIVTPDLRVSFLDLNRQQWGPIYSDLSTLITELVEQKLKLSSFGFLMRRARLRAFEKTILDGYSSRDIDDAAIICIYCARSILGVWQWYEERFKLSYGAKKNILRLINPTIRRYLYQELEYYLNRARRESGI